MELSVVPSQFLSVVLEERENLAASNNNNKGKAINNKEPKSSTVTESKPMKKDKDMLTVKPNGLTAEEKWDLTKHLPKALLAECTVEIHSAPLNRQDKVQKPRFDARVSPIFSKRSGVTLTPDNIKCCRNKSNNQKSDFVDDSLEVQDVLDMIEAVYSDNESEEDYKIEADATVKHSNNNVQSASIDISLNIEPLQQQHSVSVTPVASPPKFSFKCEHCPNVYPNRGALWQHSVATHSVEKTCECKICGRKFYRNCSLALHLKSHSEEEYCACKECGKSFTRLVNLERHMKVHSDVEQLQCNQCDKMFSDRANLLRHAVCHTSPTVRSHQCEACGKSYKSQDHLEIHWQAAHASISCSVCGKSFSSFAELTKHDATHTYEQRYACKYCGKSYSQKAVLKKHLIIHTGERLRCSTCGIEFTQRSSLLRHVKRMHGGGVTITNNFAAQVMDDLPLDYSMDVDAKVESDDMIEDQNEDITAEIIAEQDSSS